MNKIRSSLNLKKSIVAMVVASQFMGLNLSNCAYAAEENSIQGENYNTAISVALTPEDIDNLIKIKPTAIGMTKSGQKVSVEANAPAPPRNLVSNLSEQDRTSRYWYRIVVKDTSLKLTKIAYFGIPNTRPTPPTSDQQLKWVENLHASIISGDESNTNGNNLLFWSAIIGLGVGIGGAAAAAYLGYAAAAAEAGAATIAYTEALTTAGFEISAAAEVVAAEEAAVGLLVADTAPVGLGSLVFETEAAAVEADTAAWLIRSPSSPVNSVVAKASNLALEKANIEFAKIVGTRVAQVQAKEASAKLAKRVLLKKVIKSVADDVFVKAGSAATVTAIAAAAVPFSNESRVWKTIVWPQANAIFDSIAAANPNLYFTTTISDGDIDEGAASRRIVAQSDIPRLSLGDRDFTLVSPTPIYTTSKNSENLSNNNTNDGLFTELNAGDSALIVERLIDGPRKLLQSVVINLNPGQQDAVLQDATLMVSRNSLKGLTFEQASKRAFYTSPIGLQNRNQQLVFGAALNPISKSAIQQAGFVTIFGNPKLGPVQISEIVPVPITTKIYAAQGTLEGGASTWGTNRVTLYSGNNMTIDQSVSFDFNVPYYARHAVSIRWAPYPHDGMRINPRLKIDNSEALTYPLGPRAANVEENWLDYEDSTVELNLDPGVHKFKVLLPYQLQLSGGYAAVIESITFKAIN